MAGLLHRIRMHPSKAWLLTGTLVFGLLVRFAGVSYGLPLMLVADEQSYPLTALRMLELRTLVPAWHPEAFASILYYPPYLSYLYLPLYTVALGVWYAFWGSSRELFVATLTADISIFFIIARLVSVLMGVASLYLCYRLGERLFASRTAGLFSCALLATSISHIALSSVARHWVAVALFLLLILYVLTDATYADDRRYGYALLIAGFGAGVSSVITVFGLFVVLHFLLLSRTSFAEALRSQFLWICGIAALALALFPSALYQGSTGFVRDLTTETAKTVSGAVASLAQPLAYLFPSEPILIAFGVLGIALLLAHRRSLGLYLLSCVSSYGFIFYFLFRFETRFLLPIVVLMALAGGYTAAHLVRYWPGRFVVGICGIALLIIVGQYTMLTRTGDTRSLARDFVLHNTSSDDRILVYANLTRIPTTRAAVEELRSVAPTALRTADEAESLLNDSAYPHALNLYAAHDSQFFDSLPAYAAAHDYSYLVLDPAYADLMLYNQNAPFAPLIASSTVVASWDGRDDEGMSFGGSSFVQPVLTLFSEKYFGPDIVIYKLDL